MKQSIFISILFILSCSTSTDPIDREVSVGIIGWRFHLLNKIKFIDSAFDSKGQLIKDIPNDGHALRLFTVKDSSTLHLNAYVRYDTLEDESWKTWHANDFNNQIEVLKNYPPVELLETKSYTAIIDSVTFLVQYQKWKSQQHDTIFNYRHFGRIKGIELCFSIECHDQIIGQKYLELFKKSKFTN